MNSDDTFHPLAEVGVLAQAAHRAAVTPMSASEFFAARAAEQVQHHQEWRRQRTEAMYLAAGVPSRFLGIGFEDYRVESDGQRHALTMSRDFAAAFQQGKPAKRSMIFTGRPGTGKTHLSTAIIRALAARLISARYETGMSIAQRFYDRFQGGQFRGQVQAKASALEVLARPDLLVIDEVGVTLTTREESRGAEQAMLYSVINARYEQGRPTLVVSNLPLGELEQLLGERSFDRLREGGGRAVAFDWESERKRR